MAKRFVDTKLLRKGLIRGLDTPYKLLWIHIFLDCDHAGIWLKDFEIANICVGGNIIEEKAVELFDDKIVIIDEEKWFIPSFIDFQYGELNEKNRAHNSVIQILNKYKLINNKGYVRGLQAYKDKDKEQDKEQDKDKEINIPFEDFWNLYDKKVGSKEKLEKKWSKLKDRDRENIMNYIPLYKQSQPNKKYRKNPETFFNNKSWYDELIIDNKPVKFDYKHPNEEWRDK